MQNQPEAALIEFQCAYSLSNSPEALAQIGLAEQALGRWLDAERHLAKALEASDNSFIQENWNALSGALEQIRQHLGEVHILGNGTSAEVWINGQQVGSLPMSTPIRVVTGTAVIEVRAPGHYPSQRKIEIQPGLVSRETFMLVPFSLKPSLLPRDWLRVRKAFGWTATIGAAVFLGMGIAGNASREQLIGEYNDDNLCLNDLGQTRDEICGDKRHSAETTQRVAIAGYAMSGLLLGTSLILLIPAYKERARRSSVFLTPRSGHNGLCLSGQF